MIQNEQILEIARLIMMHSHGRVVLKIKDGEYFIYCDDKQVGRGVESYQRMGSGPKGWELALVSFVQEVLKPIQTRGLSESYFIAGRELRTLGHEVYEKELHEMWNDLFR